MQLELAICPLQQIAIDILGPLPLTERGNKYVLVLGDYFTKCIPNEEHGSDNCCPKSSQEFICRFGVPECLHTYQGRNFESDLIKEICKLLDIKKTRTSAYHPQSDGMIERFNRTLLNMLSTALEKNLDSQLPVLILAYRTSMQETIGATPFSLMFGRSARLPIDIEFNLPSPNYGSLDQIVCSNNFGRLTQLCENTHWLNSPGNNACMTGRCIRKLEMKCGYTARQCQKDAARSFTDRGKDRSQLSK